MSSLNVGDSAPDFTLPTDGDGELTLSELKGKNIILYFYPKDDTPGCTKEACGFNDMLSQFKALDAKIIGISKDSTTKHDKFKHKYGLNFTLVSDEECEVCEKYGTWIEKSMYGRKYMGIDRATFLIDSKGKIVQIWRKVKVPGHVDEVYNELNQLREAA